MWTFYVAGIGYEDKLSGKHAGGYRAIIEYVDDATGSKLTEKQKILYAKTAAAAEVAAQEYIDAQARKKSKTSSSTKRSRSRS